MAEKKKERKEHSQAAFRHVPPIMLSQVLVFCRAPFYLSLPHTPKFRCMLLFQTAQQRKNIPPPPRVLTPPPPPPGLIFPSPSSPFRYSFTVRLCLLFVCLSVCYQYSLHCDALSVCMLFVCLSVCYQFIFHCEVCVFAVCLSSVQFSL